MQSNGIGPFYLKGNLGYESLDGVGMSGSLFVRVLAYLLDLEEVTQVQFNAVCTGSALWWLEMQLTVSEMAILGFCEFNLMPV